MNQKIKHNRAQCLKCGNIIESKSRHDFQACECLSIWVDGGTTYIRRGGDFENIKDLTEYER